MEANIYDTVRNKYVRITYLLSRDPENGHVLACVICDDVTELELMRGDVLHLDNTNLKRERDALTKERNDLTEERDDLTRRNNNLSVQWTAEFPVTDFMRDRKQGVYHMKEIKCPKCGEVFAVDESGYAQIVQQVRDQEFDRELERREKNLEEKQKTDRKLEQISRQKAFDEKIAQKDEEIRKLKAQLESGETKKELAVSEAVRKTETEREKEREKTTATLLEQTRTIEELRAKLENGEMEKKLAVTEAVKRKEEELTEKTAEITKLQNQISTREMETDLREKSLKEQYEVKLKQKDEMIDYYKDFKARQSTKMVGESLEQHCFNQFNALRMTAFPNAYFEKDNDARTGSKGDFIFRESSDGVEFISIMFEMKNEMDETATKHKNEDFLKELDKDRREKGCEYAVLVSLLEIDNELYNNGIVDVSYRYEKMYVIRPQFFIPMITLLRNAALNSLQYRRELALVKDQQIDIVHFEENMNTFKEGFARNYRLASEKFNKAIDEIDKTISHLQKTKEALLSSENNLRLANNKAEDLSIKKLTKNAPSVRELYENETSSRNLQNGELPGDTQDEQIDK